MNIEDKRESLIKGIKRYCENIKPLNLANVSTPTTLTLGSKIQTFSYHSVTPQAKYYQFVGNYCWTVLQLSLRADEDDKKVFKATDIIACLLYHKESGNELTSGPQLKEICVIVPQLPFYEGVYTRVSLEAVLPEAATALTVITDFVQKVNRVLT